MRVCVCLCDREEDTGWVLYREREGGGERGEEGEWEESGVNKDKNVIESGLG